jgi:long-chain fatty acid transport protein
MGFGHGMRRFSWNATRHGVVLALATVISTPIAWAGGAGLYEMGTFDQGTAFAGRAALAWDASTAFTNPAGMSRLDGNEAVFGLEGLFIQMKFDPSEETTVPGSPTGSPGGFMPGGSVHAVFQTGPGQRFGISLASTAGVALDYDDTWVGRYYADESEFLTLTLNPSYSVRVNEGVSIGGGVDVVSGSLKSSVPVNNALDGLPDGRLEVDSGATGFGWNAGVLIEPDQDTRFGFTFRSGVDLNFDDVAKVHDLGPTLETALQAAGLLGSQLDVGLTMPKEVMLSGYHAVCDKIAIMGNFGAQNWKEFGRVDIAVADTTTFTTRSSYDDTWHIAFGAHYRMRPNWLGMAGFAYDSSASEDEQRTIAMPFDSARRYALGIVHEQSDRLEWGGAYEFIRGGNAPVDQTRPLAGHVVGDFDTNVIHVINFYTRWRW